MADLGKWFNEEYRISSPLPHPNSEALPSESQEEE
jgi:hypothetical protein